MHDSHASHPLSNLWARAHSASAWTPPMMGNLPPQEEASSFLTALTVKALPITDLKYLHPCDRSNWPGERPEYQSCSNVHKSFYSRAAVRTHDSHLCSTDPLLTSSYSESSFSSAIYWKLVGWLSLLPVFFSYLELPLKSQSVKAFYRYLKNESFGEKTCFLTLAHAHVCGRCGHLCYCCSCSSRPGRPSPPHSIRVSSWPPLWVSVSLSFSLIFSPSYCGSLI